MTKLPYLCLVALVSVVAVAWQTTSAKATETTLTEISQLMTFNVGYQASYKKDDDDETLTLVSQTDATETWKRSDGCTTTSLKIGFSPNLKWSGCEDKAGTQKIEIVKGKPYPLKVGNKWRYSVNGKYNSGGNWKGTGNCKVSQTERITTVSGEHDTLKVECKDKWVNRTWYVSLELRQWVRFVRTHYKKGTMVWEFVKVVNEGDGS